MTGRARRLPATARRAAVASAAGLLLVASAGCGDDGDDGASTTVPVVAPPDGDTDAGDAEGAPGLPPTDPLALADRYGPVFEAYGLRITDRGGLVDLTDYGRSDTGTHLALYAAPIDPDRSPETAFEAMVPLMADLAPDLFDRYPGLESFDVCQEAPAQEGAEGDPEIVTLVDLTRAQVESVDWTSAELEDVLRAIDTMPGGRARVAPPLDRSSAWQDAVAAVRG